MEHIGLYNWVSLAWFLTCWIGYSLFAKLMAKKTASLSSVLHVHRINWMRRLLQRDIRVGDAALLANLERNVTFFATSCVLILAGLFTALTAAEQLQPLLQNITFVARDTLIEMEMKVTVLITIFIYAFFTFTWSMRQYGFASVLVGAAPAPEDKTVTASERRSFAIYGAKIIDQASHTYNYGLRSFYFSLTVMTWFFGPWIFMASATAVIGVLYEREFHSKSLKALKMVEGVGEKLFEDDKDLYHPRIAKDKSKRKSEKTQDKVKV